jgi:putative ABC transport system ATP-binding protein
MKEKAISTFSLCKEYRIGDSIIKAINNIDLEVTIGEFISIYGPSGAGKTTLLNLIGAIDTPTSGKIIVFGHHLNAYDGADEDFLATFRATNMGFVFQSYNLISTLTALENVAFPNELAGWSGERSQKRAKELLKLVGLLHRADHLPIQLSGGEQQRVAFARALANNPPLFLVDEPTGNLDVETGLEIIRILEKLKVEGKTIIATTHDERILGLANRILHMRNGRIVTDVGK